MKLSEAPPGIIIVERKSGDAYKVVYNEHDYVWGSDVFLTPVSNHLLYDKRLSHLRGFRPVVVKVEEHGQWE